MADKSKVKIVFMGTPEFAVDSLDILVKNGYDVVGVVTSPDKPAGRGRHERPSPVKEYASALGIRIFQPEDLKDGNFAKELENLQADLFVVVAFRILPETVFTIPPLGTFNLHASFLPGYRGAAPINWAIINGEKETGVTTFFLDRHVDTGKVILREKTPIGPDETAGELHDRLKTMGAKLVLETMKSIEEGKADALDQDKLAAPSEVLHKAPKIFKEDCRIDWNRPVKDVYNFIRGLSPFPGAYTYFTSPDGQEYYVKIYRATWIHTDLQDHQPGDITTDRKGGVGVYTGDGLIYLTELQLAGKKRMPASELLKGFSLDDDWMVK